MKNVNKNQIYKEKNKSFRQLCKMEAFMFKTILFVPYIINYLYLRD